MNRLLSLVRSKTWLALALLVGVTGAVMVRLFATFVPSATLTAVAVGSLLGATIFVAGILYRKLSIVHQHLAEHTRQLTAWINVRPLLGQLPVDVGGWAMDPIFAEQIALIIQRSRPRNVLECGSGSSTALIAACLAQLGEGRVVSLDHDPQYAAKTRVMLEGRGHSSIAAVISAPLVERVVNGERYFWYDVNLNDLPDQIDLLIVDGPPGTSTHRARYPAVPLLGGRLSPCCAVLMDDGDRPDERWIAHQWSEQLKARADYIHGGKGGWLLLRELAGG